MILLSTMVSKVASRFTLAWNYTKLKNANRRISNDEWRNTKNGIASRNLFKTDIIHLFNVRCWTFDVRRSSVSFPIRLAVFWIEAPLLWNYAEMARFLFWSDWPLFRPAGLLPRDIDLKKNSCPFVAPLCRRERLVFLYATSLRDVLIILSLRHWFRTYQSTVQLFGQPWTFEP